MAEFPRLLQTVIDTEDARSSAEFWRQLLGFQYRPGHEGPEPDSGIERDWIVIADPQNIQRVAFQQVDKLIPPTWPEGPVPQQLHLDLMVENAEEFQQQRDKVLGLGAAILQDRSADPDEALIVFADPNGHPFCIFIG